jgi:serine/threonine-protein kinase ATR
MVIHGYLDVSLIGGYSGIKMNFQTIKCFTEAAAYGNKFVYQTIPRLLTLWLDMGERKVPAENPLFDKINSVVANSIDSIPVYKV